MSPLNDKAIVDPSWSNLSLTGFFVSLANSLRKKITAFRANRAFRRAEAELMALDDRMLRDIGLYRGEIASVLIEGPRDRRASARQLRAQRQIRAS